MAVSGQSRSRNVLNAKRYKKENVEHAAKAGLAFLRVGADAGDAEKYTEVIRTVKDNGLKCRYSLMKAYVNNTSPE